MDDALLVRGLERLGDLPGERQRLVERDGACRAMRSASVGPSTSSITSACTPPESLEAVDDGDVGMIERSERPRLALETREPVRVMREARRQHFHARPARPSFVSVARYTSPIPPTPTRATTS